MYAEFDIVDDLFNDWLRYFWNEWGKSWYPWDSQHTHDLLHLKVERIQSFAVIRRLQIMGLEVENCKYFLCRPHTKGNVHIDGAPPRKCGLNFPVFNCQQGVMQWFDNDYEPLEIITDRTRIILPKTEDTAPNEYLRLTLTKPTLVKTDVWHGVDNTDNPDNRVVFSIRFKGNPEFDDVKTLLSMNEHHLRKPTSA